MSGCVRLFGSSCSTLAAYCSNAFIIALSKSDGGPFLFIASIMLFVSLVNVYIPADNAPLTPDSRLCCETVANFSAFVIALNVVVSRFYVLSSTTP